MSFNFLFCRATEVRVWCIFQCFLSCCDYIPFFSSMHGLERRAERQRERFLAAIGVLPSSSRFGSTPACTYLTTRELLPSLTASIKQATFLRIPQNRAACAGDTAKEQRKKSDKKIGFIIVRPPLPVRQRLKQTRTDRTVRAPPLRRRLRIRPPKQPKARQISVYIPVSFVGTHGGRGEDLGCVEALYMALRADKFAYFRQSAVRADYPGYPHMRFIR